LDKVGYHQLYLVLNTFWKKRLLDKTSLDDIMTALKRLSKLTSEPQKQVK
jgi:hypothetical protein